MDTKNDKHLLCFMLSCSKLYQSFLRHKSVLLLQCELFHWADVLDMFDAVLEAACKKERDDQWVLPCDLPHEEKLKLVLLQVRDSTVV